MAYQAFISYSHAADDALAPALQHGLQTLARPWNRRRALEVFRDQTGLAVSPGLWSSIQAALDESEHFVLLASPEAAASPWVDREIEHWLESHPLDRLLPVLTGGEWVWDPSRGDFDLERSTAVPPSLLGRFREEPRHLDLRWARTTETLDLRNSSFREAVAQLAAPMHGMTPEDLESVDVSHYRRVVRLRRAVVAVLSVLLLLVSVAGVVAVRNTREARHQQSLAEQNLRLAEQQTRRALALQLVAQAETLGEADRSLSLLLSLEASRLDPTEAWGSLVDRLAVLGGLERIGDLPSGVTTGDPAALDPDGVYVAAATGDGDIRLWQLSQLERKPVVLTRPQDLYPRVPDQLAFGHGGVLAARYSCPSTGVSCSDQRSKTRLAIWDTQTRRSRILPQSTDFEGPTFDGAGTAVAASSVNGKVRVWDMGSATVSRTLTPGGRPTAVAFSQDDKTVAVGEQRSGQILMFRLEAGASRPARSIRLPAGQQPAELRFASRQLLVCRSRQDRVSVWDPRSGQVLTLDKPIGPSVDLAVGPGAALVTAGSDRKLRWWDLASRREIGVGGTWGASTDPSVKLAFTGQRITSMSSTIRTWRADDWGKTGVTLHRGRTAVTTLASSPTGALAAGDSHGAVTVWTPEASSGPRLIQFGRGPVTALALSSTGLLAAGSEDGSVRLWDTKSDRALPRLPAPASATVRALAFDAEGGRLAVGYGLRRQELSAGTQPIAIWDTSRSTIAAGFAAGLAADVRAVAFSRRGDFASAGSDYLTVRNEPGESHVLVQHSGAGFTAVAFSADGTSLAAAGHAPGQAANSMVGLWDPAKPGGQDVASLSTEPGGDSTFAGLAFAPDGRLLAGAGAGGLQLWDPRSKRPIGGLTSSALTSVVISADGRDVIVGGDDGRVQTYPATLAGWQAAVCAVVSRNLSAQEWTTFVGQAFPYERLCQQYPGP